MIRKQRDHAATIGVVAILFAVVILLGTAVVVLGIGLSNTSTITPVATNNLCGAATPRRENSPPEF